MHQVPITLFLVHSSPLLLSSGVLVEEEYRTVQSMRAARVARIQTQRCKRQLTSVYSSDGRYPVRYARCRVFIYEPSEEFRPMDHGQLMHMRIGVAAMTLV